MGSISIPLMILFCLFNAGLVAETGAGSEGLSNDIEEESAAQEQPESSSRSKEITDSTTQNGDIAVSSSSETDILSLGEQFDNGVESYLDNDWENCIDHFEGAIASYKEYKKTIVGCRRKCRVESNAVEPIFPEDVEDYHFYEKKVRETLCLMKCKKLVTAKDIIDKHGLPQNIEIKYIERRPYEYLHICYHQMKRHQDAANAVFTFLGFHRDHELSLKNLRYYVNLPDVDKDKLVDLEASSFLAMYKAGLRAHSDEKYSEVVELLENSIKAYIEAEDDCRLYCEGPFNQGWFPDFTMSVANHFVYGLKCKRDCSYRLNIVDGEERRSLLLDHYHYLQFAYSKLGRLEEACAAVESYLLFIPSDETVLKNKKYIMGLPDVEEEYFEPRQEALFYVDRQEYELHLLLYIQDEFGSFANST